MIYDVIVIGGGAAGMAAAVESSKLGAKTLLIEKDGKLGGILIQCIHNGFGLKHFREELTGPEYAYRFQRLIAEHKIDVLLDTFVLSLSDDESNDCEDVASATDLNNSHPYDEKENKKMNTDSAVGLENSPLDDESRENKEVNYTSAAVLKNCPLDEGRKSKKVIIINLQGMQTLQAKAVVLGMGCRERTAGSINLAGARPSGVFTAGQAQHMVNIHGKMPGKKIVIVGSGDIGLIMARRLVFEGAKVEMVLEIMSSSSGLARNVQQCLVDFDIPLKLNTTITRVVGKNRVEGVYYAEVDENFLPIKSTEKFLECDCVILSVGLIPDNAIIPEFKLNPITNGVFVDEFFQTQTKGVFACGNVLHVHDLVDNVTKEAMLAGKNAALYSQNKLTTDNAFSVTAGSGVRYVVPNKVYAGEGQLEIAFRSTGKYEKHYIIVKSAGEVITKKLALSINASEMQSIHVDKSKITSHLEVSIEKD